MRAEPAAVQHLGNVQTTGEPMARKVADPIVGALLAVGGERVYRINRCILNGMTETSDARGG